MSDESLETIPIIYEESHFLLVDKPAGMFSQAARDVPSLETCLREQLKRRDVHPGLPFVGLPHRLDRGTSGIMLIARNQRALKRFGEQFQSRKVHKFYMAVVEGVVEDGGPQRWEDFVRKIPDRPQAEVVSRQASGARLAVATVRCLGGQAGLSLLLVGLETGRMHQIRLQAASRGLPVLGDAAYGARQVFSASSVSQVASGDRPHAHPPIALHALRLEFRHPQTAKPLSGTANLPPSWATLPTAVAELAQAEVARSRRQMAESWA
ncbi:MAG: RluA family pseudouridine synthase [Planctomycetales bacterium]|nr:RluA family pseudouridine synthase [Planctomycetales bacterium]